MGQEISVFAGTAQHLAAHHDGACAEHADLARDRLVLQQFPQSGQERLLLLPALPFSRCALRAAHDASGGAKERRSKIRTLSVMRPFSTVKHSAAGAVLVAAVCG